MNPNISVIIPTYNRAQLVRETVGSVLRQTFEGYEIIVVDDGSSDETKRELEPFTATNNFRYVFQENSGRSSARNNGLSKANAEYVMFLDSDDLLTETALSTLYNAATKNPDSGLVGGDRLFVDDDLEHFEGKLPMRPEAGFESESLFSRSIREVFFAQGTYIVKRSLADLIDGFDRSMEPAEDFDFFVKCCQLTKASYVDRVVAKIRRHHGNTDDRELRRAAIRIAKKNLEQLSDAIGAMPAESVKAEAATLWSLRLADDHYALGLNRRSMSYYAKALRLGWSLLPRSERSRAVYQMTKCMVPSVLRIRPGKGA